MAQAKEQVNIYKKARVFFGEVYEESKKIAWPNRETLIQSSILVFAVIVILSACMALADVGLNWTFKYGLDGLKKFF